MIWLAFCCLEIVALVACLDDGFVDPECEDETTEL